MEIQTIDKQTVDDRRTSLHVVCHQWPDDSIQHKRTVQLFLGKRMVYRLGSHRIWGRISRTNTYSVLNQRSFSSWTIPKRKTYYHIGTYETDNLIDPEVLGSKGHRRGGVLSEQWCLFHRGRKTRDESKGRPWQSILTTVGQAQGDKEKIKLS
jgi:hypothetical protein